MELREQELALLIKKATTEVINNLMKQPAQSDKFKDVSMPHAKQILLLIPANAMNVHDFLKYAENRYAGDDLTVGTFKKVEGFNLQLTKRILNLNEEVSKEKLAGIISSFDTICFMSPGLKQMEALVEGDDSGFFEGLVIYSLLHKKKTILLVDYEIQNLPSNSFTKKIRDLMSSIFEMGIFVNILGQEGEKKAETSIIENKLIMQKDVEDIYRSGLKVIYCEKGCVITPLAKDRAKEIGIDLIQQF